MKFLHQIFLSVLALLIIPAGAFAAFNNDLSVSGDDLLMVPSSGVVERQIVKIYTTVRNNGDKDLIGTVKFFVDGAQVATDQPVSVKQGSIPDEVFVNWKAIAGNHVISAQIYPYETEGDNPSNNFTQKNFFVDWDTDGDGVGNAVDTDDDNDGLSDQEEGSIGTNPNNPDTDSDSVGDAKDAFPTDPNEQADSDGDGVGDNADDDDDNDGLPDTAEDTIGTDPLNPDTDDDGVESCNDLQDKFPLDASECVDSDGDGVGDNSDQFPNDSSENADCDSDGIGDNADEDDDNDGISDDEDALKCDADESADCDGDGIGDNTDDDDDNDGHLDDEDAFVCDPTEWEDSDRDGLGDNADPNDTNQGPVPFFEGDRIVIVNEETIFDASGSSDADGEVVLFSWSFGDGTPVVEDPTTPHVFTKIGEYVVKLTVTDDKGESRVREAVIVVENSPWLEQVLFWLMIFLLLVFLYIFYRTVKEKMKKK